VYDLKVGYSCNNKCKHCVIETNVKELNDRKEKIDRSYKEILDAINSDEAKNANNIVLTGGEPTIRREFMRIIKYVAENYPGKRINIQTNARELHKYVEEINAITQRVYYVLAIHSIDEKLHNIITDNRNGNPYEETMKSIHKIKEVYGTFKDVARIEVVISSYNVKNIYETIVGLHKLGIDKIGLSYPHMDGMYEADKEQAKKISISYADLKPELYKIYKYCKENEDVEVMFEEVPKCMWRDDDGNLLEGIKNLSSMDADLSEEIAVDFPGRELNANFRQTFIDMHKKPLICSECTLDSKCLGTWYEAVDMFGDEGFVPIKSGDKNVCC